MKNLKSNSLFILFVLFSFSGIFGQSPFVTIWKTDNSGTSGDSQIIFPAFGEYSYEWMEMGNPANTEAGTAVGEKTFDFPNPGPN